MRFKDIVDIYEKKKIHFGNETYKYSYLYAFCKRYYK